MDGCIRHPWCSFQHIARQISAGGRSPPEHRPARRPKYDLTYSFEDIDTELFLDLDEPEHHQGLLSVLEPISEQLADLAEGELVPADESILLIKKNPIEEAI